MNHLTRPADLAALQAATLADASITCFRFDTPRAAMEFAREVARIADAGPFMVARRSDSAYDVEIPNTDAALDAAYTVYRF